MIRKPTLSIGLIGSGFMGKAHVFGFATAQKVFDIPAKVNLHTLADIDQQTAQSAADEFGFKNSTDNWRDLVNNPEIDISILRRLTHFTKRWLLRLSLIHI